MKVYINPLLQEWSGSELTLSGGSYGRGGAIEVARGQEERREMSNSHLKTLF
jgi:hypothetical protein